MTSHWLGHWTKDKDNIYDLNTSLVLSDPGSFKFMLDEGVTFTLQTNSKSTLKLDCGQSETKIIWNGNVLLNEGTLDLYTSTSETKGAALIMPASDNPAYFSSSANFNYSGTWLCLGSAGDGSTSNKSVFTFTAKSRARIDVEEATCLNAKVMLNSHAFIWLTAGSLTPMRGGEYFVSDDATLHTIFNGVGNTNAPATGTGYTLGGEVTSGQDKITPFIHFSCADKDWFDVLQSGFFNFATKANDGRAIINNGMFMFSIEGGIDAVTAAVNKMMQKVLFAVDGEPRNSNPFKIDKSKNFFTVVLRDPG